MPTFAQFDSPWQRMERSKGGLCWLSTWAPFSPISSFRAKPGPFGHCLLLLLEGRASSVL